MWQRVIQAARWRAERLGAACVERGAPAGWFGYRWVRRETVRDHLARRGAQGVERYETVHPPALASNPLPVNVAVRDELPDTQGWWGFSFRDVPERVSGETFIATVAGARIVCYRDHSMGGDFVPGILSADGTALDVRETRFRAGHGDVLRRSGPPVRLRRATWFIERVYHNYSHWLTAHLPKLILLGERGLLDDVLLPPQRSVAVDESLKMLGVDPERLQAFDEGRPLLVDELTLVGTDRFRPELLRLVPRAFGVLDAPSPWRRVYISRGKAGRRRVVNEDALWAVLEGAGFERVHMEDLSFRDQVSLMRETAVLCALHGAGLANILFCPPGTDVIEIADPGFPNPNFYAMAAALGHRYWLLHASPVAAGSDDSAAAAASWLDAPESARPGWRDLRVDVPGVEAIAARLRDTERVRWPSGARA
jgi:hypothetical protein